MLWGVFKLPLSLCMELNSMVARFWWGHQGDAKGIHWIKWDKLCDRKERKTVDWVLETWVGLTMPCLQKWDDT